MSILNYHHFPIYSIMILFLGAFLTVVFGHKKALRNIFALLAVSVSLGFGGHNGVIALKRV